MLTSEMCIRILKFIGIRYDWQVLKGKGASIIIHFKGQQWFEDFNISST
jgi:hypothetical protein